ncbi:plasma membrane ascorbate-dependent reductase CYBRD1 isoform X2 [Protopterus annectens]|uniref:plasma membrane ascorbate-dependent reductase CYBRD1 isoform X2 n=1 Tax=Protopterus annectens TaxID=7888 RepID=UPI001CFC0D3C|nr:plasma membrane ascorbate-dependent reductase CYBRD1 isoform X2 [Protopterus annectens]
MEGYKRFLSFLAFSTVFGFAAVLFVLVWVLLWREGLGWDGGAPEFNWHPVLAVSGFIFIQGIAIIVYRLPWTWRCSKRLMKCIHAGLNTVAFILMSISLVAVFDFHNAKNIPNMYSLHSWIGLAAVILYSLQLFIGFLVYLLPFSPAFLRSALLPVHTYSGILIFGTVIAAALMGITEKLIFSLFPFSKPGKSAFGFATGEPLTKRTSGCATAKTNPQEQQKHFLFDRGKKQLVKAIKHRKCFMNDQEL